MSAGSGCDLLPAEPLALHEQQKTIANLCIIIHCSNHQRFVKVQIDNSVSLKWYILLIPLLIMTVYVF